MSPASTIRAREPCRSWSCASTSAWSRSFSTASRAPAPISRASSSAARSPRRWPTNAISRPSRTIGVTTRPRPAIGGGTAFPAASTKRPDPSSGYATSTSGSPRLAASDARSDPGAGASPRSSASRATAEPGSPDDVRTPAEGACERRHRRRPGEKEGRERGRPAGSRRGPGGAHRRRARAETATPTPATAGSTTLPSGPALQARRETTSAATATAPATTASRYPVCSQRTTSCSGRTRKTLSVQLLQQYRSRNGSRRSASPMLTTAATT